MVSVYCDHFNQFLGYMHIFIVQFIFAYIIMNAVQVVYAKGIVVIYCFLQGKTCRMNPSVNWMLNIYNLFFAI